MGDVIKVDFSKKPKSKDGDLEASKKRIDEALKRINTLMSEMKTTTTKDTDHVGPETE